jgi:hypothetical protein
MFYIPAPGSRQAGAGASSNMTNYPEVGRAGSMLLSRCSVDFLY